MQGECLTGMGDQDLAPKDTVVERALDVEVVTIDRESSLQGYERDYFAKSD
jgi:hypothetical protein